MAGLLLINRIAPGKQEGWRRFLQEIAESRRAEYELFQRRLGVYREQVWLKETPQGDIAIIYLEAEAPEAVLPALAVADGSFDRWLRQQWLNYYNVDLQRPLTEPPHELMLDWERP